MMYGMSPEQIARITAFGWDQKAHTDATNEYNKWGDALARTPRTDAGRRGAYEQLQYLAENDMSLTHPFNWLTEDEVEALS